MANEIVGIDLQFTGGKQAEESVISIKRQLRDATAQVALLAEKYGVTSKEATEAAKRAGQLRDQIDLSNQLINGFNPDTKFKAATSALSGLASAFGGLQGAIGLFGVESEDVAKTLLKVQSALALSQGLEALGELKDSFAVLKSVVLDALKAIRVGIGATGIGLLVIAVAALVTYWDDIKGLVTGVSSEQKKLLADTQKTADAQKKNLDAVTESENVLKLQGKTEQQILGIKIKQTEETIRTQVALLETQQSVAKSQEAIAERNKQILKAVISVIALPLTLVLTTIDEVGKALGKNFGLQEKFAGGLASFIFDPKQVKEQGEKVAKETNTQITKLKNDLAGYKLDIKKINDDAAEKELKKLQEDADKRQKIAEEEAEKAFALLLKKSGEIKLENQNISDTQAEKYLSDFEKEREAIEEDFNLKAEKRAIFGESTALIEEERRNKLSALQKKYDDLDLASRQESDEGKVQSSDSTFINIQDNARKERVLLEQQKLFRKQIQIQEADFAMQFGSLLRQIAGKNKELAIAGIVVEQAGAIAKIVLATQIANIGALATPQAIATSGAAAVPTILFNKIQAALSIASAVAAGAQAIASINSAESGGNASAGASLSSSGGGSAPIAPRFTPSAPTALDQTSINAIGNVNARAYVVESDITGSQKRIRRIENSARI
jgi:hypothetical protein